MLKSIRWKFIAVYFALLLIAMSIIGVLVVQRIQAYNLTNVNNGIIKMSRLVLTEIDQSLAEKAKQNTAKDSILAEYSEELDDIIEGRASNPNEEAFIIDRNLIAVATDNTTYQGQNVASYLDDKLILNAQMNNSSSISNFDDYNIFFTKPTIDVAFPIKMNDRVIGVLYLRNNVKGIQQTLNDTIGILIKATVAAVIITFILGYIIAKSITVPINDLTNKAGKMAKGDFNQRVEIRSTDEIGILGQTFNILTERLENTITEVEREKSKMETILYYMADGLIAVTMNGDVIHSNHMAKEIMDSLGYNLDDGYNTVFSNINKNLTLTEIYKNHEDLIGTEYIKGDDAIYLVDFAPFIENSKIAGLVLILKDITEQNRLENMRREFVANVSHELKTPLTSIKSYTETLLDGMYEDHELTQRFLGVVNSEADRMTRLVRDLLQLSSFDNNRVKWDMDYNNFVELINQTMTKLQITAHNKNQSFVFKSDVKELISYFDYDRMEQVLHNIISNAIKYTEENGKIEIGLKTDDNNAIIYVEDSGLGIPEKDIPRIFERFYRVDKARSRELGGTGLGLAIAAEILEAHLGKINIISEVNIGTRVEITIPIQDDVV